MNRGQNRLINYLHRSIIPELSALACRLFHQLHFRVVDNLKLKLEKSNVHARAQGYATDVPVPGRDGHIGRRHRRKKEVAGREE